MNISRISIPLEQGKHKRKRLLTALLCCLLMAGSGVLAVLIAKGGMAYGVMAMIMVVALPAVFAIIAYPSFGILVLLLLAYTIMFIIRLNVTSFPLGTLMDGLEALLILGFLIKQKFNPDWSFIKKPVSIVISIWIGYCLFEVVNPAAASRLAWVYTIRSLALVMLMYFIFMYNIRSVQLIRIIIGMWLTLAFIAAIYAFKQEYIGFSSFEEASLADPLTAALYFIDGHWRKFSIFSDPVAFSYNMAICCLMCVALIWGPTPRWLKVILGIMILVYFRAMLFSGTRGAYVLIPVAMLLYFILTFTKKLLPFAIFGAVVFIILIKMPTHNPTLYRFQTAFAPSDDASYNVRKQNQKRVQPYILAHPIGGGLGATGAWGVRFAPGSFLANFPPDSGYMRVAAEMGWVGLFLFCMLMFVIMKTGINNFYKIRDPELKSMCLGMTLIVFALNIGNFPQEAIVQYPTNIYFYLVAALINVTLQLDIQKRENQVV
ncbi:O-antigen ligase [Filimonas lacunae]|uniref:O-antigen ligase n=1 Tax=Filimonas lacunae TaxID=477680 RepID=A0A173MRV7_9BACT|nr:O-antigen ligase family protein [Filimonas lacunae]BAV10227.1 teichuronic acid biosynthesis protein TuaE, putative secreted polysaccharide polymerase [Filimonas lacunae]SIT18060.1 O-antigen ligase [Filimonas lacunae]